MKKTNFTNKILIVVIMLTFLVMLVACDLTIDINDNPPTEVTITFITGVEDLEIEPVSGRPNTNIPDIEDPERTGYRFTGWLDEDGNPYRLTRSEEHTSELQSRPHLVCRLLLEKKKKKET